MSSVGLELSRSEQQSLQERMPHLMTDKESNKRERRKEKKRKSEVAFELMTVP